MSVNTWKSFLQLITRATVSPVKNIYERPISQCVIIIMLHNKTIEYKLITCLWDTIENNLRLRQQCIIIMLK